MKIKNDPSNIDFNLQSQPNAWNVPVTPDGRNKIGQNDLGYADEDGITPIINAVEIDWNGAKPGIGENQTTGITTTGELLSRIKEVYSPVFAN